MHREVLMVTADTRQMELHAFLQDEKSRLWNELRGELFNKLGEELHRQYDIPQDVSDRGILAFLEDAGFAVADLRKAQLTQVEEALVKLEMGSYGLCEECGKEIDKARLRVAPYASCCVDCQERRERSGILPVQ